VNAANEDLWAGGGEKALPFSRLFSFGFCPILFFVLRVAFLGEQNF